MPNSAFTHWCRQYRYKTGNDKANIIIKEYNRLIVEYALKGYKVKLPIGSIYIEKVIRNTSKLVVLSGATHRIRKETGDNNKKIYRTNEDYYRFQWSGHYFMNYVKIQFSKSNYLRIPQYIDYYLDVPVYNSKNK